MTVIVVHHSDCNWIIPKIEILPGNATVWNTGYTTIRDVIIQWITAGDESIDSLLKEMECVMSCTIIPKIEDVR